MILITFIKQILDFFSQTAAQILMKYGSYVHLSKFLKFVQILDLYV